MSGCPRPHQYSATGVANARDFVLVAYLTLGTVHLMMFAVGVCVRAATANLMFNGIEAGDCRFQSSISGWDMA